MSFCAMAAPRCTVGTAVSNVETRDPTVMANGFATLSSLTNGRVAVGLGLGDSSVKFIGRKPATFDSFKQKLQILRSLLSGETIEYNNRSLKLAAPPEKCPPILIAAERPRTFELAGALCDGAIISPGGSPRFLAYAVGKIREAAKAAGRDPDSIYICAWTHCVVAENRRVALDEVRPEVGRTLFKAALRVPHEVLGRDTPILSDEMARRVIEDVTHQGKEYELADELRQALGDELLEEFTLAGTPERVSEKVRAISEVEGVKHMIVNFHAKDRRLSSETFARHIIPVFAR
jgi:5,10-methylenetetrahydromethanopterin reductase